MRVLALTQVAPNPPDAGPKVKTHFVLRMLAQEHRVELITFGRDEAEIAAAEQMREWCDRVTVIPLRRRRILEPYYLARGWLSGDPFLVARDARQAFAAAVHARLDSGEIDVVHADQLSMAQYLPRTRDGGVQTVFDAHNAVYDLVRDLAMRQPTPFHRIAAAIEWRLLRRFEGKHARTCTLTLAVSQHDRDLLEAAAGSSFHSAVIPIGVEVEAIPQAPAAADATRLLSVATMHYPPNAEAIRWFRDQVWPLVHREHGTTAIDVIGSRPPDDLVRWGSDDARVSVPGYVADLDDIYRRAAVFVVPLRSGSGVRVKILEAMARGIPIVSTSIGVAGLDLRHDEHLLIADTPQDFADAVLTLLAQPERRERLSQAARERVLERYDWRRCCRPLLEHYRYLGELRQSVKVQSGRPLPTRTETSPGTHS